MALRTYYIDCPSHSKCYAIEAKSARQAFFYVKVFLGQQRAPRGSKLVDSPDAASNPLFEVQVPSYDQIQAYKRDRAQGVSPTPASERPIVSPDPDDLDSRPGDPTPEVPETIPDGTSLDTVIKTLAEEAARKVAENTVNEDRVREIAKEVGLGVPQKVEVVLKREGEPDRTIEGAHHMLPDVLTAVKTGHPVVLIGPSGTGKTKLAEDIAAALDVPFYYTPAVMLPSDILGFNNVEGYQTTPFRAAFTSPGGAVHLFDEMDSYSDAALLAANAGMSNGHATFPDVPEPVQRADNVYLLAAMNTWGTGADREYVGRAQLDAASLNRFIKIPVDYDRALETTLAGPYTDWLARVWHVREKCAELKIRHVVSTRTLVYGCDMLRDGADIDYVTTLLLRESLSDDKWRQVRPEGA